MPHKDVMPPTNLPDVVESKRDKSSQRSSIAMTQKIHQKIQETMNKKQEAMNVEKKRANSLQIDSSHSSINISMKNNEAITNADSIPLSPATKTELADLLFSRPQATDNDDNTKTIAADAYNLAPYLSNEEIRGILACHVVESIVTLIDKEEKLLKKKMNELIRKQFDFLLCDISRIFSEIPHFNGLNAQEFSHKT